MLIPFPKKRNSGSEKKPSSHHTIVEYMKKHALNKEIKSLLSQINPMLAKRENDIRTHFEALREHLITDDEFQNIEAKMELGRLCLGLEELIPNGYVTMLFYDESENRIYHGAAPKIPLHFFDFFQEVNKKGNFHEMICGHAVAKKQVIVCNIEEDPLCKIEKEIARQQGFKSVWSVPILDDKTAIGTFAIFHKEEWKPEAAEIELVRKKVQEYRDAIFCISNDLMKRKA